MIFQKHCLSKYLELISGDSLKNYVIFRVFDRKDKQIVFLENQSASANSILLNQMWDLFCMHILLFLCVFKLFVQQFFEEF